MTVKSLAVSLAALGAMGAIGAAAAAVTSVAAVTPPAAQVQLAVFGAPLPLDPAADLPTAGDLLGVLNGLADANVPFASKSGLIEGGIGSFEAGIADRRMQKAAQKGQLPLSFNVGNIAPAGPGAASADVTASGPQLSPQTMSLTFVNQGGWKLSKSSAMTLLQAAAG